MRRCAVPVSILLRSSWTAARRCPARALKPYITIQTPRVGCAQVCGACGDAVEELVDGSAALPGEGTEGQRPRGDRPFSAKHARQQASIVGHLRRLGLLEVILKLISGLGCISACTTHSQHPLCLQSRAMELHWTPLGFVIQYSKLF